MPKSTINIDLVNTTYSTNKDPLDTSDNTLQENQNFEVSEDFGELTVRRGLTPYTETPTELHGENYLNAYGHGFATFKLPSVEPKTYHLALFDDESEASGTLDPGSEPPRGRYCIGEAATSHTWLELTTHSGITCSGITLSYYTTKLGNDNLVDSYSVQGFPIDGHATGYQSISASSFTPGRDKFGTCVHIGTGGFNNRTYPLLLQFIDKPDTRGDYSRGLGYFDDDEEYQGWYFSKEAPTVEELGRNFTVTPMTQVNYESATDDTPSVPPGTYTYYVSYVLDGVNETEAQIVGSVRIDRGTGGNGTTTPSILIETRDGTYTNSDIDSDSGLSVPAWDAFPKRLTHLRIYRKFDKGKWGTDADDEGVNLTYASNHDSHPPRLLATIPINGTQSLNGKDWNETDDFKPNPESYVVYQGSAEFVDTTHLKINDAFSAGESWPYYVYTRGVVMVDYDPDGDVHGTAYRVAINGGLDEDQEITLGDALPAWSAGDTIQIRIGGMWREDAIADNYELRVLDHRYDWASGEASFIEPGSSRTPNYARRTHIGDQAFVYDLWEDDRRDGTYRTYTRRIRYAVARDLGTPTIFFDGTIDLPGNEEDDPITAIIPVSVTLTNDTIRGIALVCGKKTSQIMTVENGVPTVQPTIYNFGLAGPWNYTTHGSTVYGIDNAGRLWSYDKANGFRVVTLDAQEDFTDFDDTELWRASLSHNVYPNGTQYLWWECKKWDDNASNGRPLIELPDVFAKSCITGRPASDFWTDSASYCWGMYADPYWRIERSLPTGNSEPSNYGIRFNLQTETLSKRASITSQLGNLLHVENFGLFDSALDSDTPVWFGYCNEQIDDNTVTVKSCFFTATTAAKYYDQVPYSDDKRGFNVKLKTKEYEGVAPLSEYKRIKEINVVTNSNGAESLTYTLDDTITGGTTSFTQAVNTFSKKYLNWLYRLFSLTISGNTSKTQTTKTSIRNLRLISKYTKRK